MMIWISSGSDLYWFCALNPNIKIYALIHYLILCSLNYIPKRFFFLSNTCNQSIYAAWSLPFRLLCGKIPIPWQSRSMGIMLSRTKFGSKTSEGLLQQWIRKPGKKKKKFLIHINPDLFTKYINSIT